MSEHGAIEEGHMGIDRDGEGEAGLRVDSVRSQLAAGVLVIGTEPPRLTWTLRAGRPGSAQLGYEIEAGHDPGFTRSIATTGEVAGTAQIGRQAPGGALASREERFYRVRVRAETGWSPWSVPLCIEAGLLEAADWQGIAITAPDDPGRETPGPSPCLRHEFELDEAPLRARLYVTSLGFHEVRINGQRVGAELLSPGWTSYGHRLVADTHDVTGLLVRGRNVVAAVLADGWYRGRLGWSEGEDRARYGRDLGLLLQLEARLPAGVAVIATDGAWRAATAEILSADLYDGTTVDGRLASPGWDMPGYDDASWVPPAVTELDPARIEPRTSPPVRAIERRPMHAVDGAVARVLDSGQNLAGFVRLTVDGTPGQRVTVRHAEVLEPDGALHTRALRTAKATDQYLLGTTGRQVLEPSFTFHGFRYAEVETSAEVIDAEAVAISSDLAARGAFQCSDARLVRLHENVMWSLRSNFVSIPTDCPQRDERLGWTGDAQVFASTACVLTQSEAFWRSWLRDLALDQDDELGVPSVVPDIVLTGPARYGRAGWADAATIVPWAVYEAFGDAEVLRAQMPSMRRWVDSLVRRRGADGLLEPSWQFGDWLDPNAPSDRPWVTESPPEFIANAYAARSARLVADAAAILKDPTAAARYRALAEELAAATWSRWADEVRRTQTASAMALRFDIVPAAERRALEAALVALVEAAGGRVATGFLGTPLVLPALADAGRFDVAYRMLLCTDAPSWLYQVAQGATTIWERWDAIRPDGSIHPGTMAPVPGAPNAEEGHMLSFNHYAYGAVVDWMYRHVAGLAPDPSGPAYAVVRFAPRPADAIDWARASVDAPLGRVAIDWRLESGRFVADLELPVGARGRVSAPAGPHSGVTVDGSPAARDTVLDVGPGRHTLVVTDPAVASTR